MAENTLGATLAMSVEEANFLRVTHVESHHPLDVGLLSLGEPTQEDAQKALEMAGRILAQVETLLEGRR